MLHWTSESNFVPYLIFAAAWTFICGVVIASMPAHGQPFPSAAPANNNVTIEAPRRAPEPGVIYAPLNGDAFSLSQTVDYSDLDLSKPADVAEFQKRVAHTAQNVCRTLSKRFPRTLFQF